MVQFHYLPPIDKDMISKEQMLVAVAGTKTMSEAFVKSGMKNYQTFRKFAKKFDLYSPNPGGKGTNKNSSRGYALDDILDGKHPDYPTSKLKQRLVKEGKKKDQCECCGLGRFYNGFPLSLQLDHIDGNRTNHRLENLRIICPNCHSQTPTFGSKNLRE